MTSARRTPAITQGWRRPIAVVGAMTLAGIGLMTIPASATVNDDGTITVDVLTSNDFHGRIAQGPRLAAAVEQARADNEDTLFVSAGDNIGASVFESAINDDIPTLRILDVLGLDASALGNHEFDQGNEKLLQRIQTGYEYEYVDGTTEDVDPIDFPYLGANVTYLDEDGDRVSYQPYEIVTTENGVDVGFIGVVTAETPSLVSPDGIEGVEFGDITEAVTDVLDEFDELPEADQPDIVVVLAHEGPVTADLASVTDGGTAIGDLVNTGVTDTRIDAVVTGHTHQRFQHQVERDGAQPLLVTQTGEYGTALVNLSFTWDPEAGELTAVDTGLIDLADVDPVGEDHEVSQIVTEATARAGELGSVEFGEIDGPFYRAQQEDRSENRGGESTLGNLVADVQLWASGRFDDANAADIAFMNPGGLRADLIGPAEDGSGIVTYRDVANVQPFANTLVVMDLTGAQVLQVLEEQWQPESAARPFLKLGIAGLAYVYDPTAPAGERITDAFVGDDEGSSPLDEDATYRVVTNSFLASGGDDFATFVEGVNRADTGQTDLDAMQAFFEELELSQDTGAAAPDFAQRSVGMAWLSTPQASYTVGDAIEIQLSSLSFTGAPALDSDGEPVRDTPADPQPEALDLAIVDAASGDVLADLGTVEVDNEVLDSTPETGTALIDVTIPQIDGLDADTQALLVASHEALSEGGFEFAVWAEILLAAQDDDETETPTEEEPTTDDPTTEEPTTEEPTSPDAPGSDELENTGADTMGLALGAAALAVLGGLTVALVRRRNATIE